MEARSTTVQIPKFPSVYLLHAAARVLEIVGVGSQSRTVVQGSYQSAASGGQFPVRQMHIAENWLLDAGWLAVDGAQLRISPGREIHLRNRKELARTLVQSLMFDRQPSWLATIHTAHGPRFDFVPADAMYVLEELYGAPDREVLLLAAASKYDDTLLSDLGALGESAVLAEWRSALERYGCDDLLDNLRHVSLVSDALGYDIVAPQFDGTETQLEVKCFRGRIPRCFITRNEFEIGLRLPSWRLVVCQAITPTAATVVGWISGEGLRKRVPVDCDEFSRWQVARITFRTGELSLGLPLSA